MATPECTCDPFIFSLGMPWQLSLHASGCPALCTCYWRSNGFLGRRGNVVHYPDCGWYEPPSTPSSPTGGVKGAKALYMMIDEGPSE